MKPFVAACVAATLLHIAPKAHAVDEFAMVAKAPFVTKGLPLDDPFDPAWKRAPPLALPLSSQVNFKPRIYDASARSLTVRALNDGRTLALLLEWTDATEDRMADRLDRYADAAAVQFPLQGDGEGEQAPWFCMGQPKNVSNLWFWRADRERAAEKPPELLDSYPVVLSGPSSVSRTVHAVEDLNAARMTTLTRQPEASQNVGGRGLWREGKWRVVFQRAFVSPDPMDAQFEFSGVHLRFQPVSFAVWNGSNAERDGRKAVSTFYYLDIQGQPASRHFGRAALALLMVLLAELYVWRSVAAGKRRKLAGRTGEQDA